MLKIYVKTAMCGLKVDKKRPLDTMIQRTFSRVTTFIQIMLAHYFSARSKQLNVCTIMGAPSEPRKIRAYTCTFINLT